MERLETALREYAAELAVHVPGGYTADDFYDFLRNLYLATLRHHGEETVDRMSDETLLKVLKSQVRELIQLKRIGKLLARRDRI
jgi:hypothetical protein